MASDELKVSFLGSGGIAAAHAAALQAIEGVRLVACADVAPKQAQRMADRFGCRPTTEIAEAVDAADAVWVCSPPKCHRRHVTACLEAGRHVYCEKPLATTGSDGQAIAAAADAADALAAIGFNHRFFESWRRCASVVASGRIGRPVMFICQRLAAGSTSGWRRDPEQLCGMTIESVSHDVDLMRSVMGERVQHFPTPTSRLRAADEHFIRAIRGEAELEIPIANGPRALEICAAMVASARSDGAVVRVTGPTQQPTADAVQE